MAVTAAMFGTWPEFCLGDSTTAPTVVINLRTADRCKVALYTNSWSPSQDVDTIYAVTNEVSGTGYSAGGITLGTGSISGPTSRVVTFDGPDVTWTTSTITARRSLLYDEVDSTNRVISWVDFGADVSSSAGDFKITWAAGGIFTITVAALA